MPKISTRTIEIGGSDYLVEIWYKSGKGFYVKSGIPFEKFRAVVDIQGASDSFDTEPKLMAGLEKLSKDYTERVKSSRKVIVIGGDLHEQVRHSLGWNAHKKHPLNPKFMHRQSGKTGYGFDLEAEIKIEFRTGDKFDYRSLPEGDPHKDFFGKYLWVSDPEHGVIIEFTEARADFLKALFERVVRLGEQFAEFFVREEALMIDRMEQQITGSSTLLLNQ